MRVLRDDARCREVKTSTRRFGWASRFVAPAGKKRLSVLEVLPLDGKRRLVLLRRELMRRR